MMKILHWTSCRPLIDNARLQFLEKGMHEDFIAAVFPPLRVRDSWLLGPESSCIWNTKNNTKPSPASTISSHTTFQKVDWQWTSIKNPYYISHIHFTTVHGVSCSKQVDDGIAGVTLWPHAMETFPTAIWLLAIGWTSERTIKKASRDRTHGMVDVIRQISQISHRGGIY